MTSSFGLSSSVSSFLLQSLEINSPGESVSVKHTSERNIGIRVMMSV